MKINSPRNDSRKHIQHAIGFALNNGRSYFCDENCGGPEQYGQETSTQVPPMTKPTIILLAYHGTR